MSATTAPPAQLATPRPLGRLRSWWGDVWVMTRRNLIHIRREPMQLSDVTIQPGQEDAAFERMNKLIAASVPEYQLPPIKR